MFAKLPLALLATTALVPAAALAQALPEGGDVRAGEVTIQTPSPTRLTIDQRSNRAIVNWRSFSVGANASVDIRQPDANAALLNRVTGTATSEIAGRITANGRVFLVNPNGILITRTGSVNAAGFTASTLDFADEAFMAGSDTPDVVVTGARRDTSLRYLRGGYAGVLALEQGGPLIVDLRTEGAGPALDLAGDGFLQVAVPAGGISVAGRINARQIVLTAGTAREAARGVVNVSGVLDASSFTARGGTITLTGAEVALAGATLDASGASGGGSIRVGGDWQGGGRLARATTTTADAGTAIRADATGTGDGGRVVLWSDRRTDFAGRISARGAGGGSGGDAEVSGKALLGFTGAVDLTGARFGNLLLDPYNVTISNAANGNQSGFTATGNDSVINATTLQNALAGANVTVSTGSGGSQAGDITVAAPLTWSAGTRLTLNAAGNIAVNAPITVTGGGQVALNYSTANPITGGLSFAQGSALTFADGQAGQALTINGEGYTLIRSMADLDGIDGEAASGNAVNAQAGGLPGRYALARNLAAGGTTYTSALFGTSFANPFIGTLTGLGHTIADLTIAASSNYVGLVGLLSGTVRDLGLLGGSVSGNSVVGGLAGYNTGTVRNAYATGAVSGGSSIGGLVGGTAGTVSNAYAIGAVSGNALVGGLAGYNTGTVRNAYATGAISGNSEVGGLLGYNNNGTVSNAYATGAVSGNRFVGGLIGYGSLMVSNGYWDTQTSGRATSAGGGTGLTTAQLQSGGASGLGAAFAGGTGGLYPYLASFFPNGVQAVSGIAYRDAGATPLASGAAGAQYVFASVGGGGPSSVTTGANGYYYVMLPAGSLSAGGTGVLAYTTSDNTATGTIGGATLASLTGTTTGQDIFGGSFRHVTAATTYSAAAVERAGLLAARPEATRLASLAPFYLATNVAGFTLDQALNLTAGLGVQTTAGRLTVAAPVTLTGNNALVLNSFGDLAINAPITVAGGGQVTLTHSTANAITGGLSFAQGSALTFADGQTGQALTINGEGYTLIRSMADLDGIDGVAASGNAINVQAGGLAGRYALARNLDAAGTTYTSALVGAGPNPFTGTFTGLGHTISNLTIDAPNAANAGLFGYLSGTVSDIGVGGRVAAVSSYVGGLVGYAVNSVVRNAYATGIVYLGSTGAAGGLIGQIFSSTVSNVYATGAVIGPSATFVGGLIGAAVVTDVTNAYATGAVRGRATSYVGGLIGAINTSRITNAYATGALSANTGIMIGGLVGSGGGANSVSNSYWDTQTSGRGTSAGGGTGLTTAQLQSGGASGLGAAFAGGTGGLYPYLASFFPNGVQAVSGIAYGDAGTTPLASGAADAQYVFASVAGGGLSSVTTGANGYYYVMLPAGSLSAGGTDVLTYTTASDIAAGTIGGATLASLTGTTAGQDIYGGFLRAATATTTYSAAAVERAGLLAARPDATRLASLAPFYLATNAAGFTLDQALNLTAGLGVQTTAGRLTVAAPVTLTGSNALVLNSFGDLAIHAPITVAGGGQVALSHSTANAVTGGLSFAMGSALTFADGQSGQALTINGQGYTLIRSMADLDGIDGVAASGNAINVQAGGRVGRYALARDLNAGGTTYTSALVGPSAVTGFNGTLAGLGHTIANLTIAVPGDYAGLVGILGGTVRDLGLLGGSVSGGQYVGGLVGLNEGTVSNAYATGASSGTDGVGGLVGINSGIIGNAYATGAVSGVGGVGGLVGFNTNTVSNAYATGAVSGDAYVGGLAGYNSGEVINAYATGAVSGNANVGGLLGFNGDAVINSHWNTQTSGQATSAGGTGLTTAQFQSGVASGLGGAFAGGTGGLYPYLASFFPNGVQAVSGNAYRAAGVPAAGQQVGIYAGGTLFGGGLTSTGANGYYYAFAPAGTLGATGNTIGQVLYGPGGTSPVGLGYRDGLAVDGNGLLAGLSVVQGRRSATTGLASWSALEAAQATVFGAGLYGSLDTALAATSRDIVSTAAGGFTIDRSVSLGAGDLTLRSAGNLTLAARTTTAANAITLAAGGNFANLAGAGALSAGNRWLVYSADPRLDTIGGLTPGFIQYAATFGTTPLAQASGNGLLHTLAPVLTVGLQGNVAKTYDGTTAASLPASQYALSGVVGGDAIVLAAGGAAFDTPDAGTGKTVTANGLTIASATNGGAVVYGYQLASTVATGAIGRIDPATLTYTANAASRIYGNANPGMSGTVTGFVGGETLASATTGTLLFTSPAGVTSGVGSYAILGSGLTANNGNYVFQQAAGNATALTITPRALNVTADTLSRIYGNANPALTYTVGGLGLVNGDTLSGALTTAATTTSGVGSYAIGQGTLAASGNYMLSYTGANLTITPRALSVTADALSRIYGNANPALTYTVGGLGLVNGDTLSGALATAATTASGVGSYAIGQGTLAASGNYTLSYTGANLTVTPRALTVAADALSRIYGNANPALTYTVGGLGLVNGDTLSGALTTAATTTSRVGSYAIGQGTLAAGGNYMLSYTGADLAVTPRALLVTADDLVRLSGQNNPALTFAVLGLVNGDGVTGALTVSAGIGSPPGTYAIERGTLAASANYRLTYRPGLLTILRPNDLFGGFTASSQVRDGFAPNPGSPFGLTRPGDAMTICPAELMCRR